MYNFSTFNGIPNISPTPEANGAIVITYGSFTLHNLGVRDDIVLHNAEYLKGKALLLTRETFGNDGEIFNKREVLQTIKISGTIKKSTRTAYLNFIDEMKVALTQDNQYLTVTEGAWSRRVKCTCVGYAFDENHYNIDSVKFSAQFETYKYWEDSTLSTTSVTGRTTSPYNFGISRDGTAEARLYMTLAFTSATGVTSISITRSGKGITISTPIVATDSIVMDGDNQIVLKNGVRIGFTGEIPKLTDSSNTITITVNGTFSYNLDASYRKTYK